ncbi:MAG: ATP-binding protein [Hyphomonadaceae bacterium]
MPHSLAKGSYLTSIMGALRTPRSLARRLLAWYVASVGVIILLACATLYVAMLSEIHWVDDQTLTKRLHTVQIVLNTAEGREFWLGHEVSEDMDGPRRVLVRVIENGATMIETPGMAEFAPSSMFPVLARGAPLRTDTVNGPGQREFRTLVGRTTWTDDGVPRSGIIQIAADTTLDEIVVARYRRILIVVVLVAFAVGALGGLLLTVGLITPLQRIAEKIGAINFDSLRETIPTQGLTSELQQLVRQHNAMRLRLADAYDGLRTYADNAAHELRTPLNKMLLTIGVAEMKERTPQENEEAMAKFAADCRDLVQLVDRLLFLARMSNKQELLTREPVDLAVELERIAEYFEISAAEEGQTLRTGGAATVTAHIDRVFFQRAIGNLIANAIAHTPAGGEIVLDLAVENDAAVIRVRDTGEGIPEKDLAHVFERFYRGSESRSDAKGRSGLGLAIALAIIQAHDGFIEIASKEGEGTIVTVRLPLRYAAEAPSQAQIAS